MCVGYPAHSQCKQMQQMQQCKLRTQPGSIPLPACNFAVLEPESDRNMLLQKLFNQDQEINRTRKNKSQKDRR